MTEAEQLASQRLQTELSIESRSVQSPRPEILPPVSMIPKIKSLGCHLMFGYSVVFVDGILAALGMAVYCLLATAALILVYRVTDCCLQYFFLTSYKSGSLFSKSKHTLMIFKKFILSISQIVALVGLFIFAQTGQVHYCWTLVPFCIAAITSIVVDCLTIKAEFIRAIQIIANIGLILTGILACNVVLRTAGLTSWSWTEVFWPAWLFLSILIGLSFVSLSLACSKATAFANKKANAGVDLLAVVFLNCNLVGSLVFVILLERSLSRALSDHDFSFLKAVLWTMTGFSALLAAFYMICHKSLK